VEAVGDALAVGGRSAGAFVADADVPSAVGSGVEGESEGAAGGENFTALSSSLRSTCWMAAASIRAVASLR
jgi:hypothetical protein